MKLAVRISRASALIFLAAAGVGPSAGCQGTRGVAAQLVFCQTPVGSQRPDTGPVSSGATDQARTACGSARLVSLGLTATGEAPRPLAPALASAIQPACSFDGKRILFSGQRSKGSTWQVWDVGSGGGKERPITPAGTAAGFPIYLPDGHVAYLKRLEAGVEEIFRCAPDGSGEIRLTFAMSELTGLTMLPDGRLLFARRSMTEEAVLLALRPDGCGYGLFSDLGRSAGPEGEEEEASLRPVEGGEAWGDLAAECMVSRPLQINAETLVIAGGRAHRGLGVISLDDPYRRIRRVGSALPGCFHSIGLLPSGLLVVSYRAPGQTSSFGLYEFDPRRDELGKVLYDDPGQHELYPVVAGPSAMPPVLPSVIGGPAASGRFYCLDARWDGREVKKGATGMAGSDLSRVRVWARQADSGSSRPVALGECPVESDGSFFMEVVPDVPIQLEGLASDGRVTARCAWIWVRPGENRGCIGCHEAPDLAPDNVVLEALMKPPRVFRFERGLDSGAFSKASGLSSRP